MKPIKRFCFAWLIGFFWTAILFSSMAFAAPTGGVTTSGNASITSSGTSTTINQFTDRAILNWQSFGIAPNELVQFLQPGASSIALNRVVGTDPSVILGALRANGNVWLINPNGILFGAGAQVNVDGLLASTLNIKDQDFLKGKYAFTQDLNHTLASIVNLGNIQALDHGYVVMLAPVIDNEGSIIANLGQVKLDAATQAVLNFDNQGFVNYVLSGNSVPHDVVMNAHALTPLLSQAVNNHDIVEAGNVTNNADGTVTLSGSEGFVMNGGTIQANGSSNQNAGSVTLDSTQATVLAPKSLIQANGQGTNSNGGDIHILSQGNTVFAPHATLEAKGGDSGNGGFVEVSAKKHIWINGNVDTTATEGQNGTFLIDPTNLTIIDGVAGSGDQDLNLPTINIFTADTPMDQVSTGALEAQTTTILLLLQATNSITIDNIVSNGGTIPLQANVNLEMDTQTGNITFLNPNNTLIASGTGTITINAGQTGGSGGQAILGNVTTSTGAITVTSDGNLSFGVMTACCISVNLTSRNGAILSSSVNPQVVSQLTASISAKTAIGGLGNPLVVSTPILQSSTLGANAPTYVTNNQDMSRLVASTQNGDVHISSPVGVSLDFVGGATDTLTMNLPNSTVTFSNLGGPINNVGSGGTNMAKSINVQATTGIGSLAQPLLTQTQSLALSATSANAPIFGTNSGSLTTLSAATNNGNVQMSSTDGATLNFVGGATDTLTVTAPNAGVTFSNNGGPILNLGATNNITAQSLTLNGTSIGTLAQPLRTTTSSLSIQASGTAFDTNAGSLTGLGVNTTNSNVTVTDTAGESFNFVGGATDTLTMNLPNASVTFFNFGSVLNLGATNNIVANSLTMTVFFGSVGTLAQPLLTQVSNQLEVICVPIIAKPLNITDSVPYNSIILTNNGAFAGSSPLTLNVVGSASGQIAATAFGTNAPLTITSSGAIGSLSALTNRVGSPISVTSGPIGALAVLTGADQNMDVTTTAGDSLHYVGGGTDTLTVNFPNSAVQVAGANIFNLGATNNILAQSLSIQGGTIGTLAQPLLTQTPSLAVLFVSAGTSYVTNTGALTSLTGRSIGGSLQINTTTGDSLTFNAGPNTLLMSMPNTDVTFASATINNSGVTNNITAKTLTFTNGGGIGTLVQPLLMNTGALFLGNDASVGAGFSSGGITSPAYITNSGPFSNLVVGTASQTVNLVFGVGGTQSLTFNGITGNLSVNTSGINVNFLNTGGSTNLGLANVGLSNSFTVQSACAITNSGVPTNIVASTATLDAVTTIGTPLSPINTSVSTLNAATLASGSIYLNNSGPLTLASASAAGLGSTVSISNATGDMTIAGTVAATNGNVQLTSTGSILQGVAGLINASATSTLTAGNVIDPLQVSIIGGALNVSASGAQGGISVNINGTVSPSNTLVHVGSSPGAGYFNGICLWNCPSFPITPSSPNPVIPSLSVASVFPDTSTLTYEPSLLDEEDTSSETGLPLPDVLWIFRLPFLSTTYEEIKTYYNQYKPERYRDPEEAPDRKSKIETQ